MTWFPAIKQMSALASLTHGKASSDLFAAQTEQLEADLQRIQDKLQVELLFSDGSSDAFPEAFRSFVPEDRPRYLFAAGNLDLLTNKSVGICGSRHASTRAMDAAQSVVTALCRNSVTVVSGYAAGIDQMAHKTSLAEGGETIVVLPEGIANFAVRKELRGLWDWKRVLLLSQFELHAPWRPWNAMLRNRTIVGLSDAMLVVEAKATGGTFDAGEVTLRYGKPLFAVQYAEQDEGSAGNKILVERGAHPLKRQKDNGQPSIGAILNVTRP